jgi:hypothetical protein
MQPMDDTEGECIGKEFIKRKDKASTWDMEG